MAAIYNFLKPHPIILQRVGLGVGIPLTATVFERMYRGKSTLSTSLLAYSLAGMSVALVNFVTHQNLSIVSIFKWTIGVYVTNLAMKWIYTEFYENLSIEEVRTRIASEAKIWEKYRQEYQQSELWPKIKAPLPGDWRQGDRVEFWGNFSKKDDFARNVAVTGRALPPPQTLLGNVLAKIDKKKEPPTAVELGYGGSLENAIHLLNKGWRVVLVDSSPGVFELIKKHAEGAIQDGWLQIVTQEIETYVFPKNVQLVYANDVFSYCNPAKICEIWDNIRNSLAVGGYVAGTFFPYPSSNDYEKISRLMGAWFIEKSTVRTLLTNHGYKIERLKNDSWWSSSGGNIEFIGRLVEKAV